MYNNEYAWLYTKYTPVLKMHKYKLFASCLSRFLRGDRFGFIYCGNGVSWSLLIVESLQRIRTGDQSTKHRIIAKNHRLKITYSNYQKGGGTDWGEIYDIEREQFSARNFIFWWIRLYVTINLICAVNADLVI